MQPTRELAILYRGPLSSCNYDCSYCPFAKHRETAAELKEDRIRLERFEDWAIANRHGFEPLSIFFTPWGEGLTRRWYREAMANLSQHSHIQRIAIQTNLSCQLEWLQRCDKATVALWCTWHPTQVSRDTFVRQVARLHDMGVRHSVGVVGLKETASEVEALRRELPADTYLWINAYKREADYYDQHVVQRFTEIDPLFPLNNQRHASRGKPCATGESVISVDGDGNVKRCHFVSEIIGNIYEPEFAACLQARPCPNDTCGCHIGYVHLHELKLGDVFGDGLLERIPGELPTI